MIEDIGNICILDDDKGNDSGGDDDYGEDDDDIYIMMYVCVSRKMSTSSWESPVTTCNHP